MANKNDKPYPSTLIASSIDDQGNKVPLANTDDLYDKVQEMMQQAINGLLSKYFNFKAGGNPVGNTLSGNAISNESISVDKLDSELKGSLYTAAVAQTVSTLNRELWGVVSNLESLVDRVEDLEANTGNNPNYGHTELDGFFVVDDNNNIGACVLPSGLCFGWDGNAREGETVLTLTKLHGGTYVVIHGADYSNMNIGNLDQNASISYVYLSNPVFSENGRTFTITAIPDSDHDSESENPYTGGYNWTCYGYTHLISLNPAVQHGETATFEYTQAAEGQSVEIKCRAIVNNVETSKRFNIPTPGVVEVETITPKIKNANIDNYTEEEYPFYGSSITFMPALNPTNATVGYYKCEWYFNDGGPYVDSDWVSATNYEKTITIPSSITSPTLLELRFLGKVSLDGAEVLDSKSVVKSIYVCHHSADASPTLRGIYIDSNETTITQKDTQLSVATLPADATIDRDTVVYDCPTNNATVSSIGVVTVNDDIAANEDVIITASVPNPSYDSSTPVSDDNQMFLTTAVTKKNAYVPPLEKIEIVSTNSKCKNFYYKGDTVSFEVIPTPNLDRYKDVTWKISTRTKLASVDAFGNVSINSLSANVGKFTIALEAASNVSDVRSSVILTLEYENETTSLRPVRKIYPIANIAGDYVDFYAYGTTGNGRDATVNVDANVTWSVEEVVSATQATDDINDAIAAGTASPEAAAAMIMPVNGIESPTSMYVYDNSMTYYSSSDVSDLINPSSINNTKGGLMKSRSAGPAFSDPNHPNRLVLLSNTTEPQIVTIRCTYTNNDFSTYYVQQYAFTYQTNRLGVPKKAVTNLYLTTNNLVGKPGLATGSDTGLADWKYLSRDYIKPYAVGSNETDDDYVFDWNRIGVCHEDGEYESSYSLITNGYGSVGSKMHIIEDTNASEKWYICYALEGEERYWLKDNRKNAILENDGNSNTLPNYYYPVLRNVNDYTVNLSCPAFPVTATGLTINGPQIIDGTALGAVEGIELPNVAFTVKDSTTQEDLTSYVVFTIYDGLDYCSMNTLGNRVWLHSTGGEWKDVTIKAYISEKLWATKTIQVKMN